MPSPALIPLTEVPAELLERILAEVNTSFMFCDPPPPEDRVREIVTRAFAKPPRSLSPGVPVNPKTGAPYILPIVSELSAYVLAVVTGADEEDLAAEDGTPEEALPEYDPEQMAELEKGAEQAQEDADE